MTDIQDAYADGMSRIDGVTFPSQSEFARFAQTRRVVPVARRVLADSRTPVELYEALTQSRPGSFLLESAENGRSWSRYSFIGLPSEAMLSAAGDAATWVGPVPTELSKLVADCDPMEGVDRALKWLHSERLHALPPLTSGLVGMIGYDAVRRWEKLPGDSPDVLELPEVALLLATDIAVYDHFDATLLVVANVIVDSDASQDWASAAYQSAVVRIDEAVELVAKSRPLPLSTFSPGSPPGATSNTTPLQYHQKVEQVREHIYAGDAFQVVVSQRFSQPTDAAALDVYRVLRVSNPSPYMYLFRFPAGHSTKPFDVVGSSPEALVTLSERRAVMHPIAGTRPRGKTPEHDQELADDLLADDKERAEHLMLVDLGRNDLGKVCRPGTVEVVEFMQIERYSHVMHIVSTVVGELDVEYTAYDLLAATFPAGTLSGAPKPRAMQIIDELETSKRGLYGGCVGYLDFAGDMDTAIAIRTAVLQSGLAYVQAGAGLVADSNPEAEDDECHNKAAAVLRAISVAETLRDVDP